MWIKVSNLQGCSKWYRTPIYDCGFLWLSDYQMKELEKENGDGNVYYELHSMLPFIAIANIAPKKLLCNIYFDTWSKAVGNDIEEILIALENHNLRINEKDNYCFRDYDKIHFCFNGHEMVYDEFVNNFKLPKGCVFHEVFDNGYSYIGSESFHGDNKAYADTAIKVAKRIGYVWFDWRMGFRLDDNFAIHVSYGEDKNYSEVSNT